MSSIVLQLFLAGIFEIAFTAALVAGGLLFLGGLLSFVVFLYRSTQGDGMRDPREVVPEKTKDENSGVTKGDPDEEWDYY